MGRTETTTTAPTGKPSAKALAARVAELEAQLAQVMRERDALRASYERLRLDVELLQRRIVLGRAERIDTKQLELEFASKLQALDKLSARLDAGEENAPPPGEPARKKPRGRRNLRDAKLPEERIEISDPIFEEQVAHGKAERIGFEESYKLGWQRGGMRRIVVARVKYRIAGAVPEATILATTPMPKETFARSLFASSLLARVLVEKYLDGMPLHRQEGRFARDGVRLDRGTMSRWIEDAGATAGATVVSAMRDEALRTAFCIATDATGVLVQPTRNEQIRQPCRRGHYFVQLADRDHVFFECMARETSQGVGELFKGFTGFVQADAKSVYDALFRPPDKPPDGEECARPTEIGCWSHARRKFWEATVAKNVVGREGLARIARLFALERKWKRRPAAEVRALRAEFARPHLDAFFAWAEAEHQKVLSERGLLRTALGYVVRQKVALLRYLDDGRLVMDNNRSERELRRIAVGRKAWLFVGSDDHAQAAGHIFSLVASAKLHGLDPEAYLRDLFRVLGHWPRDRYLELSPRYWTATRAKLDETELAVDLGPLTVPPTSSTPEEK
jgi:transposase